MLLKQNPLLKKVSRMIVALRYKDDNEVTSGPCKVAKIVNDQFFYC